MHSQIKHGQTMERFSKSQTSCFKESTGLHYFHSRYFT